MLFDTGWMKWWRDGWEWGGVNAENKANAKMRTLCYKKNWYKKTREYMSDTGTLQKVQDQGDYVACVVIICWISSVMSCPWINKDWQSNKKNSFHITSFNTRGKVNTYLLKTVLDSHYICFVWVFLIKCYLSRNILRIKSHHLKKSFGSIEESVWPFKIILVCANEKLKRC